MVARLGTNVEPGDRVEVDGRPVTIPGEPIYLLLNKPTGVVTTMRDPAGRRTVAQLVPVQRRVVPVGRLDYDTGGALLMTDDGELAHRLLHPRFGVEKTYRVTIAGRLTPQNVGALMHGIRLDDFRAAGAKVRVVAVRRDHSVVDVTIHEGRNRQVRRMFEALGHPVRSLVRIRFGPLALGQLAPGEARQLTRGERAALERYRRPTDESPRTKANTKMRKPTRGGS